MRGATSHALLGSRELGCELQPPGTNPCVPKSSSRLPHRVRGLRAASGSRGPVPGLGIRVFPPRPRGRGAAPGTRMAEPLAGDSRTAQQFRVSARGHRRGLRRPPEDGTLRRGGPRASASREAPGRKEAPPSLRVLVTPEGSADPEVWSARHCHLAPSAHEVSKLSVSFLPA